MVKKTRQEAIKELIKKHPIEEQATLVQLIKDTYGIETNQSIISRDLRAMGVSKQKIGSKMVYELKDIDASREILHLGVLAVDRNETTIVIKTLPGLAAFVGDFLDMHEDLAILGTIAGENTVFVAPRIIKEIETTFNQICTILHVKK